MAMSRYNSLPLSSFVNKRSLQGTSPEGTAQSQRDRALCSSSGRIHILRVGSTTYYVTFITSLHTTWVAKIHILRVGSI